MKKISIQDASRRSFVEAFGKKERRLGLFYKRLKPDAFKKIYGAVVIGSIPLLVLLVPFGS